MTHWFLQIVSIICNCPSFLCSGKPFVSASWLIEIFIMASSKCYFLQCSCATKVLLIAISHSIHIWAFEYCMKIDLKILKLFFNVTVYRSGVGEFVGLQGWDQQQPCENPERQKSSGRSWIKQHHKTEVHLRPIDDILSSLVRKYSGKTLKCSLELLCHIILWVLWITYLSHTTLCF